ncbi:protein of unknown function [Lachnospiraceae bacterium XBB1006]|nr:protein of unknown function [Lachnospiraceae bacterium XBB1006]
MIKIECLRDYINRDMVFVTGHAAERFRQRGISVEDIRSAVETGEIIEQYPDDYPFPSCLICGTVANGKTIHVCMSDEGTASRIITAYYPDANKWSADFKVRKEQ